MRLTSEEFRRESGLASLSQRAVACLLQHIYERLELAVELRVAELLTDAQRTKLDSLFAEDNPAQAFCWLHANLPEYRVLIEQEEARLEGALRREAHAIVEIELALEEVSEAYELQFRLIDKCGGQEPPLAA